MGEAKQRRLAKLTGKPWDVDGSKPKQANVCLNEGERGARLKTAEQCSWFAIAMSAIGDNGPLRLRRSRQTAAQG